MTDRLVIKADRDDAEWRAAVRSGALARPRTRTLPPPPSKKKPEKPAEKPKERLTFRPFAGLTRKSETPERPRRKTLVPVRSFAPRAGRLVVVPRKERTGGAKAAHDWRRVLIEAVAAQRTALGKASVGRTRRQQWERRTAKPLERWLGVTDRDVRHFRAIGRGAPSFGSNIAPAEERIRELSGRVHYKWEKQQARQRAEALKPTGLGRKERRVLAFGKVGKADPGAPAHVRERVLAVRGRAGKPAWEPDVPEGQKRAERKRRGKQYGRALKVALVGWKQPEVGMTRKSERRAALQARVRQAGYTPMLPAPTRREIGEEVHAEHRTLRRMGGGRTTRAQLDAARSVVRTHARAVEKLRRRRRVPFGGAGKTPREAQRALPARVGKGVPVSDARALARRTPKLVETHRRRDLSPAMRETLMVMDPVWRSPSTSGVSPSDLALRPVSMKPTETQARVRALVRVREDDEAAAARWADAVLRRKRAKEPKDMHVDALPTSRGSLGGEGR